MGLFNTNYSKPGPGIYKNAPKKKGLRLFYDILFRKIWELIRLNVLYILTLIPTFAVVFLLAGMISNQTGMTSDALMLLSERLGAGFSEVDAARISITTDLLTRLYISLFFTIFWGGGPATAGFVYILRSYIWEDPVFPVSDFFEHIKSNFRQSITVWIIDIAAFTVMCYAYFFYGSLAGVLYYLKYVILVLAFFYTLLHLFIYHLLITYKLTIGKLYKNAALFALSSLPWCVLTIAATAFIILIFPAIGFSAGSQRISIFFITLSFAFILILLYGVCGLIIEFNTCRQIRKYIKEDSGVERNE